MKASEKKTKIALRIDQSRELGTRKKPQHLKKFSKFCI